MVEDNYSHQGRQEAAEDSKKESWIIDSSELLLKVGRVPPPAREQPLNTQVSSEDASYQKPSIGQG